MLTLGANQVADFGFFFTEPSQLRDERRHFTLTKDDFGLLNPNTGTCPVFRSKADADLTKRIYRQVPILWREASESTPEENPWCLRFMLMFMMNTDSHLFAGEPAADRLPLYEAKMIHQYDHRWATYRGEGGAEASVDVPLADKQDPAYAVRPRYWVEAREVYLRTAALADKAVARDLSEQELEAASPKWLMGWRDIARATDERTVIASVLPLRATGDTLLLMFPDPAHGRRLAALLADQCSLVHDYAARQKVGGTHLKYHTKKQIPVLPPGAYTDADLAFITPRVLELTYTAHDLKPWAEALGFEGPPFPFDPDRRAQLRAELDAYYARRYGLTREDLCYILDPASVMGADYPSETFRVLKQNEEREFGEYRTQRLVLAAWDALERGELRA